MPVFSSEHFSSIYVDNFGHIYLLNPQTNTIKKLNEKLEPIHEAASIRRYGNIHSLYTANGLKVLAFYKNQSTVVILDKFLNTTSVIDLRKAGIMQSSAIALSYDNDIWVFDSRDTKLKKVGEKGNVVFSSSDLKSLLPQAIEPLQIIDKDGLVYLYDKRVGLLVLDYYGSWNQLNEFVGYDCIALAKNGFVGLKKGSLIFQSLIHPMQENILTSTTSASFALSNFNGAKCFLLNKDSACITTIDL